MISTTHTAGRMSVLSSRLAVSDVQKHGGRIACCSFDSAAVLQNDEYAEAGIFAVGRIEQGRQAVKDCSLKTPQQHCQML